MLARVWKKQMLRPLPAPNQRSWRKYTFHLARAFNLFYHRHRIIAEEDAIKRAVLIAVADDTRQTVDRCARKTRNHGAGANVGNDPNQSRGCAA